MKWPLRKLETVADFRLGKMLDEKKNKGELKPYLANINVRWGEIELNDLREMRFEDHESESFGLKYGDIVMCEGGEPGRCALWKDQIPDIKIQKALHRIRPQASLNPEFLYYVFLQMGRTNAFAGLFTGATIKHLPREKLALVEVPVPPRNVQDAVARVLTTYDSLVENNRRRMALLEESARLLYREWFVRLRFPGHEHSRITDGVPTGWQTTDLSAVCMPKIGIQTGPFGSQLHQSDYSEEGFPVVMPKDIIGSTISTESIARVPEAICHRLPRHILQEGDIVLARRGDIGRKSLITSREAGWMCGTGCMRLRANTDVVDPRFLFATIGREDVMGVIASRAQGAIMPNLNLGILADIALVLPPKSLQQQFLEYVSPVHRQIEILQSQNEKLRTARDLLLPRLMNGEITV